MPGGAAGLAQCCAQCVRLIRAKGFGEVLTYRANIVYKRFLGADHIFRFPDGLKQIFTLIKI